MQVTCQYTNSLVRVLKTVASTCKADDGGDVTTERLNTRRAGKRKSSGAGTGRRRRKKGVDFLDDVDQTTSDKVVFFFADCQTLSHPALDWLTLHQLITLLVKLIVCHFCVCAIRRSTQLIVVIVMLPSTVTSQVRKSIYLQKAKPKFRTDVLNYCIHVYVFCWMPYFLRLWVYSICSYHQTITTTSIRDVTLQITRCHFVV